MAAREAMDCIGDVMVVPQTCLAGKLKGRKMQYAHCLYLLPNLCVID